jgi:hypothetical protein
MTESMSGREIGRLRALELRDQLLEDLSRWQAEMHRDEPLRGTLELGIAMNALREIEGLLRLPVETMLPEAKLPERATLGQIVGLIEQHGRGHKMECLALPRRLLTRSEIVTLNHLTGRRNRVAHVIEHGSHRDVGRLSTNDVLDTLSAVEGVARLPLFDELACRTAS